MMGIEHTIEDIGRKLREGRFPNEQAISQGVVLRILSDLGWEVYDTTIVWPEYATGEGRVDFALCAPPEKPRCFVEVKQPGKAEDGIKQALEYAFHTGAQFVTLTDGQTWSFYLPAEPGSYEDRRVFKLDLFERTEQESAAIFRRYLERERVASGEALDTAREEYRDRNRRSAAQRAIPDAWKELVERADELLVELLTDAVESKAGIRPQEKDVLAFFARLVPPEAHTAFGTTILPVHAVGAQPMSGPVHPAGRAAIKPPASGTATGRVWAIADEISTIKQRPALRNEVVNAARKETINPSTAATQYSRWAKYNNLAKMKRAKELEPIKEKSLTGIDQPYSPHRRSGVLHGKQFFYESAKQAMVFVLTELAKTDSTFLQRCSQHRAFRGRTRRYIARDPVDLYPGRPHLIENHDELPGGWVVGTNLNNRSKKRIIKGAAEVAGIRFGRDVVVEF